MSLLRVSEKKLAANRANARLSKGPSTPEGKARSSQNACKHHLYAKKYQLPPEWTARVQAVVAPCAAIVDNPVERASLVQYIFLKQWLIELDAFETRLLNHSIASHRNFNRGIHHFVTTNPLFHAIESRIHSLNRRAERARRDWERTKRAIALAQMTPNLIETKPLMMAAAAGGTDLPVCRPAATQSAPPISYLSQLLRRGADALARARSLVSPIRPPNPSSVTFQPDLHLRNWNPHHVH